MGTGDSLPRLKQPKCEADNSPPYSAKVKNVWSFTTCLYPGASLPLLLPLYIVLYHSV